MSAEILMGAIAGEHLARQDETTAAIHAAAPVLTAAELDAAREEKNRLTKKGLKAGAVAGGLAVAGIGLALVPVIGPFALAAGVIGALGAAFPAISALSTAEKFEELIKVNEARHDIDAANIAAPAASRGFGDMTLNTAFNPAAPALTSGPIPAPRQRKPPCRPVIEKIRPAKDRLTDAKIIRNRL